MTENIQWTEELRTDNEAIDTQHQWLFDHAAQFFDADESTKEFEEISKTVLQLYQYMETHFEKEEVLAKEFGFPQSEELSEAHQYIVDKMNAMLRVCTSIEELQPKLHAIFSEWLKDHVLTLDKDLAAYIKENRKTE
jgi:hemerythrin